MRHTLGSARAVGSGKRTVESSRLLHKTLQDAKTGCILMVVGEEEQDWGGQVLMGANRSELVINIGTFLLAILRLGIIGCLRLHRGIPCCS